MFLKLTQIVSDSQSNIKQKEEFKQSKGRHFLSCQIFITSLFGRKKDAIFCLSSPGPGAGDQFWRWLQLSTRPVHPLQLLFSK